jgi:hypothetical protein
MNVRPTTAAIAAVLTIGLGFAAGTLPKNSVGSPQIKNGQVASADLKNGGVTTTDVKDGSLTAADLAAGTVPAQTTIASTKNGLSCLPSGWCYLPTSGSGATVGSFDTAPANATGWSSTGTIELGQPATVLLTASPLVWFFGTSNHDVLCTVKDGATNLLSSGWVRSDVNQSQVITISGRVSLSAGTHAITLACLGNAADGVAVNQSTMTALIVPSA